MKQRATYLEDMETLIGLIGMIDHAAALEKAEKHSAVMRAQVEYYQHNPDAYRSLFGQYDRLRLRRYERTEENAGKTKEEWLTDRSYSIAKDWLEELVTATEKAEAGRVEPGFEGHGLKNGRELLSSCAEGSGEQRPVPDARPGEGSGGS